MRRSRVRRIVFTAVWVLATVWLASVGPGLGGGAAPAAEGAGEEPAVAAAWPCCRHDPGLRAWVTDPVRDRPVFKWQYETEGYIAGAPVVVDGTVYLGAGDTRLRALDLATGRERWTMDVGASIDGAPAVHGDLVFLASGLGTVTAVDLRRRAVLWTAETQDQITGTVNVLVDADGAAWVVVGSHDNNLYCFAARTGQQKWAYATDNFINGTPAVAGQLAIAGGCDETLHVVDVATGEARHLGYVGSPIGASPAIDWPLAFVGTYETGFVCLDLAKEEEVWYHEGSGEAAFSSPAVSDTHVVYGDRYGSVFCLDRATGDQLWEFAADARVETGLTIAGDKAITGSDDGRFYVIDIATGNKTFEYETGGAITATPVVVGSTLLVGSNDGNLYAFDVAPEG